MKHTGGTIVSCSRMDSDDNDKEKAEAHGNNDRTKQKATGNGDNHQMAEPTSEISGTCDIHTLYEERAKQYLQLSDGRKALINAMVALKYRHDSFNAHWLVGKAYVSMAMYEHGMRALTTAIELCCLEDKRQEIVIDLLLFCCSKRSKFETLVLRKIPCHTWAKVAYELTKTRRFEAAYMAYSQLQDKDDHIRSGISVDLEPLCDPQTVTTQTWILDLVTWFLRHGSDHNTMTPRAGDTFIHVVVRMTLAAGMLGLLEYVLKNVARPGELRTLVDCLGNTALHMAARCQKCCPIVRLDVMTLLVDAGIDGTAKNVEGKTAGSYLLRSEKDFLKCHLEYHSLCSDMMVKKTKHAMDKINDILDIATCEDENEDSTQNVHVQIQGRQATEGMCNNTVSPRIRAKEDNKWDTIKKENSFQSQYQNIDCPEQSVSVFEGDGMSVKESALPVPEGVDEISPSNLKIDQTSISECLPVESGSNKTKSRGQETTMILVPNGLPKEPAKPVTEKWYTKYETATGIPTDVSQIHTNAEDGHLSVIKTDDVADDSSSTGLSAAATSEEFCDDEMEYVVSLNMPTPQSSKEKNYVNSNEDNGVTQVPSKIKGSDNLEIGKKEENESREIDLQQDVGHRAVEINEQQIAVTAFPEGNVSQAEQETEEELLKENEIEAVQQKEKEKDCDGRSEEPSELEYDESKITQKVSEVKSLKKERLGMWNTDKEVGSEDENKVDNVNIDEFTASNAMKQVDDGIKKENRGLGSKGESVPVVLLDHVPDGLRTRERLSYEAAEFHYRKNNEVRMMVNLECLEHISDRITFLKNEGYFDQACTLLQREGKYDEATHLYLIHGKSKEAVETARKSRKKDLIGECLIVDAQVMIRKKPENKLTDEEKTSQKDEILQTLQEAIDILLQTSNQELRGEACFLKGEITNEVTDINESWGAFNECIPRCEAGQLECMDLMVRYSDLHNFQNLQKVVKGMENLFGVLNLLVSSDKSGSDRVYRYYGLRPTSDGFLKMFPQQKPRALNIVKHSLSKAERKKTECEVSRKIAHDDICCYLLDRGHYWYGEVTLALNKLKKQREQCRQYTLGQNCTKSEDGGKCSAVHGIMTERGLKSLIDVDLLHLEMDWYVQQGCGRLLKDISSDLAEMVNVFLPDTTNDHLARFKSCEVLLHHLMPRERFPFRMTERPSQANKLQNQVCKVYIRKLDKFRERKYLKEQMVSYLKAKFNYMKTQDRKTNTDVFMKLYFLVNYFYLEKVVTSNLMMEFETEVRNEHLQKNDPRIKKRLEPLGFLVDNKDVQNISVQCVARRFCEAYYQLTIPADPMEALIKFTKFIVILGDRNKTAILPELSDFLMWMEYFMTVAICFGAKYNQVTNVFFLPASYLSLVYFIDSSFQNNGQPTFELIQRNKQWGSQSLTLSQERAERIISVLCGSEIRMNMIRILFKLREDRAMDFGLAERLLVLCMTVLCNMGKALFANKEAVMMQQLCLIALPDDCPNRLLKAVRALQEAEGLADIAATLKELLYDRDQEHISLCHWLSTDRCGIKSNPLVKLTWFPSKFFNPNTKIKMTNPGQGKVAMEEDEDATAGPLAELDTDMTMEEKFKWESEQKKYAENQRQENASLIITRFFKKIRFRLQCSILHSLVEEELQKEQTEKRLKKFRQFGIDDRACTICDVIFDKPSGNLIEGQSYAATLALNPSAGSEQTKKSPFASLLNPFSALFNNSSPATIAEESPQWQKVLDASEDQTAPVDETGDSEQVEESLESLRAKKKLEHEQSLSHTRNMTDFQQLKKTYKTQIAAKQEEIVEFIRKHDLRNEKGLKNYADMKLDLTRLVEQSDIAQNEFERILAKRDWGNTALLSQFFNEASGCFSNVKAYVEEQWKKLQETKDKAAESSKSRTNQAGQHEDWDEEIQQLEDVVQEPVRQREKKGKGRGKGRGRARHRQQDE